MHVGTTLLFCVAERHTIIWWYGVSSTLGCVRCTIRQWSFRTLICWRGVSWRWHVDTTTNPTTYAQYAAQLASRICYYYCISVYYSSSQSSLSTFETTKLAAQPTSLSIFDTRIRSIQHLHHLRFHTELYRVSTSRSTLLTQGFRLVCNLLPTLRSNFDTRIRSIAYFLSRVHTGDLIHACRHKDSD